MDLAHYWVHKSVMLGKIFFNLRVNVSKDQSRYKQGSVDLADFHTYCSVFHANSRGDNRFSKFDYCSGLR